MLKFLKFSSLFFLFSYSNFGHANYFKDTTIGRNIVSEIKNLTISTHVDVLDLQTDFGLSTNVRYNYKLEPSFIQNKFARIDEWVMVADLKVGDVLDELSPVHFNIQKGSKVVFIRNFDSQWDGLKASPYSFKNIPYNWQTTLERLNVGDFVSFPASLNLDLGVTASVDLFPYTLSAGASVIATGEFTTFIYKIDETRVRLKLVAQTKTGTTTSIKTESELKFTGLSLVDDKIEDVIELDLFESTSIKARGEQYILDYIFDLSNENARIAFDEILNPKKKLNLSDMLLKYSGIEYIEDKLISDYALAEKLHGDKNGVERIFKGFNNFKFKKSGFKLGLLVSRMNSGRAYFRNHISIEDKEGVSHSFFFPNRVHFYKEETRAFFIKRQDKFETSFYGLIPTSGPNFKTSVANIGISHWREDDFLTAKEWRKVKQELVDLLPIEIISKIDFSQMDKKTTKQNSKVRMQILFKDSVFEDLKNKSFEEVHEMMERLLKERNVITKTKVGGFFVKRVRFLKSLLGINSRVVYNFSKKFHHILTHADYTSDERIAKFLELPDSYLFKRYGIKLFLYLLDNEKWEENVYIDFEILANDINRISYKMGTLEFSEVFKQILQANKEFYSPSNDLRIISELE